MLCTTTSKILLRFKISPTTHQPPGAKAIQGRFLLFFSAETLQPLNSLAFLRDHFRYGPTDRRGRRFEVQLQEKQAKARLTKTAHSGLRSPEKFNPSLPVIPPEVWSFRYVFGGPPSYFLTWKLLGSLGQITFFWVGATFASPTTSPRSIPQYGAFWSVVQPRLPGPVTEGQLKVMSSQRQNPNMSTNAACVCSPHQQTYSLNSILKTLKKNMLPKLVSLPICFHIVLPHPSPKKIVPTN